MKSDPANIPEMVRETRDNALRYANAVDAAEHTDRKSQWTAAAELAMDARESALMTINSVLVKTCPAYREEHDGAIGYTAAGTGVSVGVDMGVNADATCSALLQHDCKRCQPLLALVRSINGVFAGLWAGGPGEKGEQDLVSGETARDLHSGIIGQVYITAFMASRHFHQFS